MTTGCSEMVEINIEAWTYKRLFGCMGTDPRYDQSESPLIAGRRGKQIQETTLNSIEPYNTPIYNTKPNTSLKKTQTFSTNHIFQNCTFIRNSVSAHIHGLSLAGQIFEYVYIYIYIYLFLLLFCEYLDFLLPGFFLLMLPLPIGLCSGASTHTAIYAPLPLRNHVPKAIWVQYFVPALRLR